MSDKIVGRRLLRILWDANAQKPVLVMERCYPTALAEELKSKLDEFVSKRAKELGLDLYEEGTESSVKFESISSRSPWEYVDSNGGIAKDGTFTVTRAKKVQ